jgi:elongation factor P--(R)-beta-lysine ligase
MDKASALITRSKVMQAVRGFFMERGFLEVETPLLIPANAPEEYIDPIPALPLYLQTSPELCMKRLLCRGYKKIFQISRCFRQSERGARHLSEFTMLEWYRADSDYTQLMDDCQGLLAAVASVCLPAGGSFSHNGCKIDPFDQIEKIRVSEAFLRYGDISISECLEKGIYEEILSSKIEPALSVFSVPVVLQDFPPELAALARIKPDDGNLAERFELYLGGLELANGFSELNDAEEQRARFEAANRQRVKDGREQLPIPEPFLAELDQMPQSAGIALGLDRLVMLVTGASKIDQVVAFTPEEL